MTSFESLPTINYSSRIEGQTKVNTLTWTVPRFIEVLSNKITKEYRTDTYKTAVVDPTCSRFQLKMLFSGHDNDLIEFYYESPTALFLKSILTICLKRFEERSVVIKEYHTIPANKWQHIATLFKREVIGSDGHEVFLLNDGSLRLKFQFIVSNDVRVEQSHIPEAQLSMDFESLLNNGLFSDVIVKSVNGTEYNVHKAVLASRSIVLKAHFEHNTTECQTNVLESPLDAEVLKEVLTFIYSDNTPSINDIPEKLLGAADYYQLGRLKCLCEEALHKKLTVENAIETLQLADLHSAKVLKQMTLEFIKDGQAKLITTTEGWKNLQSVELIKSIYDYIMNDDIYTDMK